MNNQCNVCNVCIRLEKYNLILSGNGLEKFEQSNHVYLFDNNVVITIFDFRKFYFKYAFIENDVKFYDLEEKNEK